MASLHLANEILKVIYPVNSIYISSESKNPNQLFGGTWEKLNMYLGGELIAYGCSLTYDVKDNWIPKDEYFSYSDNRVVGKNFNCYNYIDGILTSEAGAFKCHSKGLVGMVECDYTIGGLAGSGMTAMWFNVNANPLPDGVNLLGDVVCMKTMTPGFCGCTGKFIYELDEHTNNKEFYINPKAAPYGGAFAPTAGGVRCGMTVKCYAKKGVTNIWRRTA